MKSVPDYFGSMVFNDVTQRSRLPRDTYKALKKTMSLGKKLDPQIADVVANAMKDWAIEKGATHFTHWFQPMNGVTAEKHDSFISPFGEDGVIMEFSGKELVRGEPDASSLPSGGIRSTYEARGYTTWDPTSYAFIKDNVLCIPTAFCSYGGEALDKKTPLLRSMEAISKQAIRVLRLFGRADVNAVRSTVGPEQEYFLIDKKYYDKRIDLQYCDRTLFGANPPKCQDLEDHYFGAINPRVTAFMKELDEELWKLGILAKTEHNETAPAQYELAPVYTKANIATDHNQLTMELMKKIAQKYDLVCLLHEKPFDCVNGSGKHNNWSLSTDTGDNLFEPGETPHENAQFLLFLCAVIQAVDDYQELLRISVASAGNDHRLGADEAPPAVVSIFLGDELNSILESIDNDSEYEQSEKVQMKIGVHTLPRFPKDSTDRNRTSPFAFTGNKFEFRMLGSADSISDVNVVLNTAVAESLKKYADILENAADFNSALHNLIKSVISQHKRIIFSGNGYDEKWIEEAVTKRGLANLPTTPDALAHFLDDKNITLFENHRVYTEAEMRSRHDFATERYCKVLNIECRTMLEMLNRDIIPAISKYTGSILVTADLKNKMAGQNVVSYETGIASVLDGFTVQLYNDTVKLGKLLDSVNAIADLEKRSFEYKDKIIPLMGEIRSIADTAETLTAREYWPYPTYGDMLLGM